VLALGAQAQRREAAVHAQQLTEARTHRTEHSMPRTPTIVTAALALLAGCQNAQYQDPQGTTLIVSLNKVDIQDFASAADTMVNSMVEAGVLAKAAHQPALLGISKVENRTDSQFDTDELVKKIRVALLKGGRAQVTQQLTLGNAKEDPLGDQANQMKRFQDGTDRQPIELPDFTLSGKILFDRTKAGSTRQVAYIFQMSLVDTATNRVVWEDEKTIVKQGNQNQVGF
jgi:uncharacterized protein (TIGR02722 family)